jgi:hypothetical protein
MFICLLNSLLLLAFFGSQFVLMFNLSKNEMMPNVNKDEKYLAFRFLLQGRKRLLCVLNLGLQCLSLLRQSVALASGNIDIRLFSVDLGRPRLQFLLLFLNFIMENLGLV